MAGKFPGPYINDVPAISGGTEGPMEYVESFATTGIGARRSGQPANPSTGPKSIEHVGGSQGQSGKHHGTNPGR